MSRVGLANLFDRAGGSLTKAIRDEIEKDELKKPHHQLLIAKVRKRWDTWNLREDQQGDDCLEYDSFYNGFMAPYFGRYRCEETKQALQAIDMDNDGYIEWSGFLVYLKISDGKNKKISTNKRQRQPTGSSTQVAEKKKKKVGDPSDLTDKGYLELCDNMAGIDLLQELKNMEQRITATLKNDKESEIKSMEERLTNNLKNTIDQSMKEVIQSLTSQSAQTISNHPTVQQNCREIRNLKEENAKLTKQVQILSSKQNKLQQKITLMEQKNLENCLVFRGLSEDISENDYNVREKIYKELAHIFEGNNYAMNLSMAKKIVIKRCKRVGRFSHTRPRPVSVEFEHIQDVEFIMENKGYLRRGVYVDREYIPEIERKRRILLPVLKAAKLCKDYKKSAD